MTTPTAKKLDALSDEFQSTFTRLRPGVVANMFYEDERPIVEALIKKHLGAKQVRFIKMAGFGDEKYAGWIIKYKCRTKKGKSAGGGEYWSKRPMSNAHGAVPGKTTKKITARKERMAAKKEIRKDAEEEQE